MRNSVCATRCFEGWTGLRIHPTERRAGSLTVKSARRIASVSAGLPNSDCFTLQRNHYFATFLFLFLFRVFDFARNTELTDRHPTWSVIYR